MSLPRIVNLFEPDQVILNPTPEIEEPIIIEISKVYSTPKTQSASPILPKAIEQKPVEKITTKQLTNPIIVPAVQATPDIEFKIENTLPSTSTTDGTAITGLNPSSGQGNGNGVGTGTMGDYGNELVTTELLDKKPEFPGGMEKFYRYVGNKFVTPNIDSEKTIRIIISFVVEKDGSMTDIQVRNNPGYGLEKEAVRVLKSLKTKWTPGIINSKPVRTAYNLPITVQMN
jgi:protein TonB